MMRKLILGLLLVLASSLVGVGSVEAASNRLTWTDNSNNEATFNIERKPGLCPAPGTFVEIATTGPNVTTFDDLGLTEGLAYCYRVAASNAAGKSAFSNTADRLIPLTIPAAPANTSVTAGP